MQQHQLIAALILLLSITLANSLPVNSAPTRDDTSFKAVESIDMEDDNSSFTLPSAPTMSSNDSESSVNATQSNHTWPSMEDPNLFEGDIKASKEIIDKYYGELKEENSTKVGFKNTILSLHDYYYINFAIRIAKSDLQ